MSSDAAANNPVAAVTHASDSPASAISHRWHFLRVAGLGLLAGGVAVLFEWSLFGAEHFRDGLLAALHLHPAWGWCVLPLAGALVGSVVGLMGQYIEPDAGGSGIPHIKGVLLHVRAMRPARLMFVKFVGGVLGIGAGLSLGREGPTVQLGAAIGQIYGNALRARPRVINQLVSCGAGAGLAAAFNAPLAGFIFVIEELRREMSPVTYGGTLIAAVCADIVARSLTGQLPSFRVSVMPAMPLISLPAVALLGALGGVFAVSWNKLLMKGVRSLRRLPVPAWSLPGIAAATAGLIAWWIPEGVGGGHPVAERILTGQLNHAPLQWLSILLLLKLALTVFSYSSGAPGGIFAPMLLMGALLGLLTGRIIAAAMPWLGIDPQTMAILGMAAWFSGSIRAPLTGMVLLLEMTGNHHQLFALAVVCLCAYLVAEALHDPPIYDALLEEDLHRRGLSDEGPGSGAARLAPVPVVMGVQHNSPLDGILLRDARFPDGCLVVGLERRGTELVPTGATRIMAGDHVTVHAPANHPEAALAVVDMCRGRTE